MRRSYPTLSLKDRDWRWRRTREWMKGKGLDCLLVAGLKGRERYEGYLTNEYAEGIVVFPREGEPAYLTWTGTRVTRRLALPKDAFWVKDIRVGVTGAGLVAALKEKGLDGARIGVVGLDSKGPAEMEGIIPYKTWSHVVENLPRAIFVEVSQPFAELMLVKSERELALARYSAQVGELACEAMMKATRAGARETKIYAAIMNVIHSHGAISPEPRLNLTIGPDNLGWGPPLWTYWGGRPRRLEKGNVVLAEIFPCYGGIETQQQMAVAVKPVSTINQECADAARASYKAGLAALRPGRTFQEVADAMELPLTEAGCWHLTPLIHSLAPLGWTGHSYVGIEQLPNIQKYKGLGPRPPSGGELVIKPGMLFELEPNACKGEFRVNIGGAVLVTEDGVEELNSLPTEMRAVE